MGNAVTLCGLRNTDPRSNVHPMQELKANAACRRRTDPKTGSVGILNMRGLILVLNELKTNFPAKGTLGPAQ